MGIELINGSNINTQHNKISNNFLSQNIRFQSLKSNRNYNFKYNGYKAVIKNI